MAAAEEDGSLTEKEVGKGYFTVQAREMGKEVHIGHNVCRKQG